MSIETKAVTYQEDGMDFAAMLEESFKEGLPERGDIVSGTVLAVDQHGLLVDIGMKNDGMVIKSDLERLEETPDFQLGDEIMVMVIRTEDVDGNLIVSVAQAKQAEDWTRAEELMEASEIWEGEVIEANRGGLIVPFGNLRGFIPASHVVDLPRGLSEGERKEHMQRLVGQPISIKIIEVNRKRRRLVLSQREAMLEQRTSLKEQLLEELQEGETHEGVISGLRDFGAFVDLGGADGLIHISELAWHRIRHPREVVAVGDKVKVYILSLDQEGKRIGLSLKRLQENPWEKIEDMYHIGQLVVGTVSRLAQFGVFVSLEPGIEALLHSSQISDQSMEEVEQHFTVGQTVLVRIISIEADRQRLGLSLKEVTHSERVRWAEENDLDVTEIGLPLDGFDASETQEAVLETDDVETADEQAESGQEADDMVDSVVHSGDNNPVAMSAG